MLDLQMMNPGRSFATRIGMVMGAFTLALALVLSYLAMHIAELEVRSDIEHSLAELAFQMTDKLDRGMFERYREIQLMAQWPGILSPSTTVEEKRRLLQKSKETYSIHSWIGLTDEAGIVIAATDGLLEGGDVSKRPWFQKGIKQPYIGDVHTALLLNEHLGTSSKEILRFVDVAAPVRHDSETVGVLCSHLNWQWANEIRSSLAVTHEEHYNIEFFIFNTNGEVLLAPYGFSASKESVVALQEAFPFEETDYGEVIQTWPDGKKYLTGFARSQGYREYPGLPWNIAVRQPVRVAFAPARELAFGIFAVCIGIGLPLIIVMLITVKRLVQPLRMIADEAERIDRGEIDDLHLPSSKKDEIGVMARTLVGQVEILKKRNQELEASKSQLEQKVRERTAELQESEELLQLAQKIARVGSFEYDKETGDISFSDEMYTLLGYRPEDFEPSLSTFLEHIHPNDKVQFSWLGCESADEDKDAEVRIIAADGVQRYVHFRSHCIVDRRGGMHRVIGIVQDISERKRAEQLREEVERIVRHDLKTPLNAIINVPNILFAQGGLDMAQMELLDLVRKAGDRMLKEINQSLDIYKMEVGSYELVQDSVDLLTVLRSTVRELELNGIFSKNRINILFEARPVNDQDRMIVNGSCERFQSMIGNIVRNALESSPEGGTVHIGLWNRPPEAIIEVHNQGVVPPEIEERFFDKYSTRKATGMGLGTYSARLTAVAHGGNISMETSESRGTLVTIRIPLSPEQTEETEKN